VIPIGPDTTMPTKDTIDGLRHANREPAHTTLELRRPVRLYHQVQMIRLNAVLQDAESRRAGSRQRVSCGYEGWSAPERGHGS
jgi:hypothetical protein